MQELVLLKLVDAESRLCLLSDLDGNAIGEVKLPRDVLLKAFPTDEIRWGEWAKRTASGTNKARPQTAWERKADAIATAFQLRRKDLKRFRKPKARAQHLPFETSTWASAAHRMENASRLRWYRKMRSPWKAWAETCSRNQNRRNEARNAGCERNGQDDSEVD